MCRFAGTGEGIAGGSRPDLEHVRLGVHPELPRLTVWGDGTGRSDAHRSIDGGIGSLGGSPHDGRSMDSLES